MYLGQLRDQWIYFLATIFCHCKLVIKSKLLKLVTTVKPIQSFGKERSRLVFINPGYKCLYKRNYNFLLIDY